MKTYTVSAKKIAQWVMDNEENIHRGIDMMETQFGREMDADNIQAVIEWLYVAEIDPSVSCNDMFGYEVRGGAEDGKWVEGKVELKIRGDVNKYLRGAK